jgi:glycosyltransferase involved in cell wall biosynthesis
MKGGREPILSVIVANYNNEAYISDCLDSILLQTYKKIEIVVFDDGSTDDSPAIIREYEKKYPYIIKGFFINENKGVASTRHEAILNASGKYITTLDSDDYYYDRRKLEKEMELIRYYKEKNNKEIIAYSNIILVNGNKNLIGIWGNQENLKQGKLFYEIITRNCMIPRDFIIKRNAYFEVGGYDNRFPIYEDWDLKIRLAAKYEFYYSGINGTAYRRHGTGLSAIPISENIRWLKKVLKKNFILLNKTQKKDAVNAIDNFIKLMKVNNSKSNYTHKNYQ